MTAILVHVTAPADRAAGLARALVEALLAACVNVLPTVRSIYRWKGVVDEADESLLLIKTTAERFEALKAELLRIHPYELPEVLAVPIAFAHAPYLAWLIQESSPSG